MLPDRYLIAGLDGLCRAYQDSPPTAPHQLPDGFVDGHRAAGMLACCHLFQDGLVDPAAAPVVQDMLDQEWIGRPLFAASDPQPASEDEFQAVVALLARALPPGSGNPHDFIFPSVALRTFAEHPALRTRARLAGLRDMARHMLPGPDRPPASLPATPGPPFVPEAFPDEVLGHFQRALLGFPHYNTSYSGHLLTWGLAVMQLHELGHEGLARTALAAFRRYALGCAPRDDDAFAQFPERAAAPAVPLRPEHAVFWLSRPPGNLESTWAHLPKYAHAFLWLCARARDRALVETLRSRYDLLVY